MQSTEACYRDLQARRKQAPDVAEVSQTNVLPAFARPRNYIWTPCALETRSLHRQLVRLSESNATWKRKSKMAWTRSRSLKLARVHQQYPPWKHTAAVEWN